MSTYTITDFWFYNKYKVVFRKKNVYILLSGGFDSRVLLELIVRSFKICTSFRVFAVHINHGVACAASSWEKSCYKICYFLNVPILQIKGTLRKTIVCSENSCRNLRGIVSNNFLLPNSVVVTAHHSSDCVETVLQRLCRSVGYFGFSGIYYKLFGYKYFFLRPLLYITKGALYTYAVHSKILWVDDYTNYANLQYTRNYIRQYLVEIFKRKFFSFTLSILKFITYVSNERYNFFYLVYVNFKFVVGLTKLKLNILRLFSITYYMRYWVVRFWIFSLFFFVLPMNFYEILHYFLCQKIVVIEKNSVHIKFFLFTIDFNFLSVQFLRKKGKLLY